MGWKTKPSRAIMHVSETALTLGCSAEVCTSCCSFTCDLLWAITSNVFCTVETVRILEVREIWFLSARRQPISFGPSLPASLLVLNIAYNRERSTCFFNSYTHASCWASRVRFSKCKINGLKWVWCLSLSLNYFLNMNIKLNEAVGILACVFLKSLCLIKQGFFSNFFFF